MYADKIRRQSKCQKGVSVRSVLGRGICMTWPSQENRVTYAMFFTHHVEIHTYVCTNEHMCRQPIMHAFGREQSLKIRHCRTFTRAQDLLSPPRSNYSFAMYRCLITKCLGRNEKSRVHDCIRKMKIHDNIKNVSKFQLSYLAPRKFKVSSTN